MEHLRELISGYNNQQLLEQFIDHQEEYTPEALKIIKKEIDSRNIEQNEIDKFLKNKEVVQKEKKNLNSTDFKQLDHSFSHTDILLASAILNDSKVIFFVDNQNSSDTLPLESEASQRFTIRVHNDYIETVHQLLDEHFEKKDGMYSLKNSDVKERLKAFSFHDLHLSELEAAEKIEVALTSDERRVIIHFGNRLLEEADKIEEEQERVLFYYDSIESLNEYISDNNNKLLSRSDLLAILEILQVYCMDREFPQFMDETISTLLGFFMDR